MPHRGLQIPLRVFHRGPLNIIATAFGSVIDIQTDVLPKDVLPHIKLLYVLQLVRVLLVLYHLGLP